MVIDNTEFADRSFRRMYSEVPSVTKPLPRPVSDGHVAACEAEAKLVRDTEDRTSEATRRTWPEIDWDAVDANRAAVAARRKEDDLSLGLDCMCEKNDPDCAECWVLTTQNADPYLGGICYEGAPSAPTPALTDFDRDVRYRFDECLELLLRKHKDYSGRNIAQAPGGALNGLRVRMHDKMVRINNLIDKGVAPEYEPLRDSFLDLANYSIIALMVLDGVWPSE